MPSDTKITPIRSSGSDSSASKPKAPPRDILSEVVRKIQDSESILVALSNNPSVDELAAAIALTMALDKMGKHGTAIFSGKIPPSIDFLQPDKTLEDNTNSLQDFIITLNKEKADHLRYKIEGDFVKIYITPYRTQLTERDLEFSRGEYNVNLVISLNVANADDLDAALSEHGRIMHDASAINITVGVPGKFGDLEWIDPSASSISEIVTILLTALKENDESLLDPTIATALLAGLMAATDRFGNERTTPTTMTVAAKLMEIGADQSLISANIATTTIEPPKTPGDPSQKNKDRTKLTVRHDEESGDGQKSEQKDDSAEKTEGEDSDKKPDSESESEDSDKSEDSESRADGEEELEKIVEPPRPTAIGPVGSLMEEINAAATPAVRTTKDYTSLIEKELAEPLPYENEPEPPAGENPAATAAPDAPSGVDPNHVPPMSYNAAPPSDAEVPSPNTSGDNSYIVNKPKTVLKPLSKEDTDPNAPSFENSAALISPPAPGAPKPSVGSGSLSGPIMPPDVSSDTSSPSLPMPSSEPLPPPPPPFDPNNPELSEPPSLGAPSEPTLPPPAIEPIAPATPPSSPDPEHLGDQPAMQDQVYSAPVNDPASFRLPNQ